MVINPSHLNGIPISVRTRKRRWLVSMLALGLAAPGARAAAPSLESRRTLDRHVVQTADPEAESSPAGEVRSISSWSETEAGAPRIASVSNRSGLPSVAHAADPRPGPTAGTAASLAATDPISQAKKEIAACQERFRQVHDYTCTFVKRERIDGRLTAPHMMTLKARTNPNSLYFKFHQPNRGREAIYVQGRNNGRIVAHDVGLGKFLAGTMHLDPLGSRAMEENRHPVTEAGLGVLIDTVAKRWASELSPGESIVLLHPDVRQDNRSCTLIETIHPRRGPNYLFHKVKLYVDKEKGLPIRFEAFDWPKHPGDAPELVEEYAFLDLKTNVGLHDRDFDPSNQQYSFGRF